MVHKDPRIDLYISKSADFAKPILTHLRQLIHSACPDVQETIKWGFPHFVYKDEILCSMASFKQHCAFGFWKASLMKDKTLIKNAVSESAMGHYGKITSLKDLAPDKKIISHIKEAMMLNEKGIKPRKNKITKANSEIIVPDFFLNRLKKNKQALKTFEAFRPSHKREYVEWITEAKTENTRNKRMETAIDWLAEGKPRNWKYMKK
ncbi:YdeI/OmpD-associated family protein [Ignavibacterium sp.]|uniref:YdeI/OmpD-associated family protein n=1 Tax=Ignavibacterium sp. TaxID=2651167 RepID=UPI00307E587C